MLKERKKIQKQLANFNILLNEMNRTYYILKEMDDLTEDNFLDKIRDITTFEFNEKQLNMLKTDIFNESNEK